MNRVLKGVLVLLFPAFLLLNVWQAFSYRMMQNDIADMEQQQKEMLEENKRLIIGIECLRTPNRLEKIAEEDLGMKRAASDKILRITVPNGEEDG